MKVFTVEDICRSKFYRYYDGPLVFGENDETNYHDISCCWGVHCRCRTVNDLFIQDVPVTNQKTELNIYE